MSSGKYVVRMSNQLHSALKQDAAKMGCSLNDLSIRRLCLPSCLETLPTELREAVSHIAEIAGESLVGLVVFGSWARGDDTDASDIDLLVVLDAGIKIDRALYRLWEERESAATKIEPHFVNLPDLKGRVSGLWAEVSLDGLVVFDGKLAVQRYLQHVRSLIRSGRLVAKRLHGQNYWVHEGVA